MDHIKIANQINNDIRDHKWDQYPWLKKQLKIIAKNLPKDILVVNRKPLSNHDIEVLKENEYITEFEYEEIISKNER